MLIVKELLLPYDVNFYTVNFNYKHQPGYKNHDIHSYVSLYHELPGNDVH